MSSISFAVVNESLDNESQLEIIDSISTALNESYIFPDVAKKMETYLRTQHAEKAYRGINSVATFANRLTDDLRSVCNDAHLKVEFHPDEYFTASETESPTDEQQKKWYDDQAYENFGFTKVERLPGNVGYVQMNGFYDVEQAGPTAIAAMTFLAHCDAIIFDLRANTGGWPSMILLLAGYFFDQPVQLSSFYIRKLDQKIEFWTQLPGSGSCMTDVKLYILTSRKTLSAAEAFAYDLKHLGKAIVIGETTAGAAHPTEEHRFPDMNITVSIPYGRPISPITGTNWEGTGVKPHIQVPGENALEVAHLEALKALILETNHEEYKAHLQSVIQNIDTR
jgi:C-terminal processing protease CtpA/Prc